MRRAYSSFGDDAAPYATPIFRSVSQSSGAVRVWKGGQAVLELQQVARRS